MRQLSRSALVLLALLAASAAALAAQQRFYLHDKDTVVFYGDSITEQRLYTTFVETFVLTRYPQLNVRFVNSGWVARTLPAATAEVPTCGSRATCFLTSPR